MELEESLIPPWWEPISALGRSNALTVLAVLIVQIGGELAVAAHGHEQRRPLDVLALTLLAVGPLLLFVCRRYPREVLVAVTAVTGVYFLHGYPYGPAFASLVVAVFVAVNRGHHSFAWATAAAAIGSYAALEPFVGWTPRTTVTEYIGVVAWLLVVLVGSEAFKWRRERWFEAARLKREELRRQAGEDRVRMAQELHDVLAHNISLINVRAGVAIHLMDSDPNEARAGLEAIRAASKDALSELRTVLGILHQDGQPAPIAPTSGMARLQDLVDDSAASGTKVETVVEGPARPLPVAIDVAAFRIIQEALTNVRRHARSARAQVSVRYASNEVVVEVDDWGQATVKPVRAGNGIRGMHERANALGGQVETGPRNGGGFRVVARLPYGDPG